MPPCVCAGATAKEPVHAAVFSRAWNILKTLLPKIGDREVEIVAEIQLHLDFYLVSAVGTKCASDDPPRSALVRAQGLRPYLNMVYSF